MKYKKSAMIYAVIFILFLPKLGMSIVQGDETSIKEDINHCTDYYPFTYSKCLKICSDYLESTCLDDQLCFCDMRMQIRENGSTRSSKLRQLSLFGRIPHNMDHETFGVKTNTKCKPNEFCHETCTSTNSVSGLKFQSGILCETKLRGEENVKACVCAI